MELVRYRSSSGVPSAFAESASLLSPRGAPARGSTVFSSCVPPACPALSSASGASAPAQSADIDENPRAKQGDHLTKPSVRHERQRESGGRDQTERHGHVHECRKA